MSIKNTTTYTLAHPHASKLIFAVSIFVFMFYLLALVVLTNVYQYAVVGALCELLFLPMLALLIAIPVLSIVQLIKYRKSAKAYPFLSLAFIAISLFIISQNG
jgi:hypothetical protein